MTSKRSAEEWYLPMEALAVLAARHGAGSKALIADKLKDGLVRAHADKRWDSDDPTLNAAWRNRNRAEIERDVLIERQVWRSSRHRRFEVDLWRWPDNRFVVTRRKRPAAASTTTPSSRRLAMKGKPEFSLGRSEMFLFDPQDDNSAPLDLEDNPIAATESCIAFESVHIAMVGPILP